jgi:putative effector of murein hydrolase
LTAGGSIPLVVVLAILSGIIGVLVGGYILKLLQIPPGQRLSQDLLMADDYVTRGVTLGINASAISTAQLLTTDPRAAALSSLSFAYLPTKAMADISVFGALMVVLTAITPIAVKVQQIAGV